MIRLKSGYIWKIGSVSGWTKTEAEEWAEIDRRRYLCGGVSVKEEWRS